jgi:phosphoribosylformylglycinamidine synthase II
MNKSFNETLQLALKQGLTENEFKRIVDILGRLPNEVELGMYAVMWSEHCSYKNSIVELKKLPRSGRRLLVSAGEENAGLVDIGNGLAVAFKIESHNHPSAVEPYQGAATGVGGIMRDIFTMGARPIAALNSLRFGNPNYPRTSQLVKGIVKGIGDYGNSFGVPTVAGDIFFDDSFNENPIVNAMAVGIVETKHIATASAKGNGNVVMIAGSSTGRDGIHGATFASDELDDESEHKRPSVQVGDPFTEKLLLEATLEAIREGLIVGIQDMGAAGITCSCCEMSARGNVGMNIDLDKVPQREKNMSAYEIILSESQERMLLICQPDDVPRVRKIYEKWDIHCEPIGEVTENQMLRVYKDKALVAEVPAFSLVLGSGAPVYQRESKEPEYLKITRAFDTQSIEEPRNYNDVLLQLLSSPNICTRQWIIQQYDHMVQTNLLDIGPLSDAAIIRIKGTKKALAVKTDCNPRYVYLNPYEGAKIAVAEAARNVVCVGATPIAITNCLNFGNPYDPEIFWQFKEAVQGIGDACKALDTPVTGGNVSFYNENPSGTIFPTPTIGMLGLLDDYENAITANFKNVGDIILLLGETHGHIGASEYLHAIHNKTSGETPHLDLLKEKSLQQLILRLVQQRLINSCHDVSEGGLAVALAECCIPSIYNGLQLGATVSYQTSLRNDFYLFGEDQSRVIVSLSKKNADEVISVLRQVGQPYTILGEVTRDYFMIGSIIKLTVHQLSEAYLSGFPVK